MSRRASKGGGSSINHVGLWGRPSDFGWKLTSHPQLLRCRQLSQSKLHSTCLSPAFCQSCDPFPEVFGPSYRSLAQKNLVTAQQNGHPKSRLLLGEKNQSVAAGSSKYARSSGSSRTAHHYLTSRLLQCFDVPKSSLPPTPMPSWRSALPSMSHVHVVP